MLTQKINRCVIRVAGVDAMSLIRRTRLRRRVCDWQALGLKKICHGVEEATERRRHQKKKITISAPI